MIWERESGADLDLGVWRNEIGITRIHDSSLQEFGVMVLAYAVNLFHFSLLILIDTVVLLHTSSNVWYYLFRLFPIKYKWSLVHQFF